MTIVDSTRSRHSHRATESALDAATVRIELPRPRRDDISPAVPPANSPAVSVPVAPVGTQAVAPAAPTKRRRWPWVVAAGVGGLIVIANAGGGTTPAGTTPAAPAASSASSAGAAAPSASPSAPAAVPASFTSGTYQVGVDLKPGRYKTQGGDFCGWSRNKSDDGQLDSIIANDILQGPGSVTVKPTDKFIEFSGDCTWTRQ